MSNVLPLRDVDLDAEARPIEWVIEDFAARGKVTMIAGIGGGGKSRLCLQWALMASANHRVVVVDAENGMEIIQQRLAALPEVHSRWPSNPRVFEAQGFDMEIELAYLEDIVSSGCDLLLLDSWVSLWDQSENSTRLVKRALDSIRDLAIRYNTAVVLIHHTTKEGEDYRGSSAIGGAVDATFLLNRGGSSRFRDHNADANKRVLTCTKMRFALEPAAMLLTQGRDGLYKADIAAPSAAPAPAKAKHGAKVPVKRPPTVREILDMEKRGIVSKRGAQQLLYQHHQIGDGGQRWWRFGR